MIAIDRNYSLRRFNNRKTQKEKKIYSPAEYKNII